jgi:hypothetical protein
MPNKKLTVWAGGMTQVVEYLPEQVQRPELKP